MINVDTSDFVERQGCGAAQINENCIVIFGGFNGEFLKDVHILNHNAVTTERKYDAPQNLFAYQMPTLFDK